MNTVDLHRPAYHYLPPGNWLNDPNGLIHWQGEYHLFYQYNPHGPFHGTIHWGHASSRDLVHWVDLPIALTPTPGGPDQDGCWSGCAVDDQGVPTLIYTGLRGKEQRPCVATSADGLRTWQKYAGNPVIAAPPPGLTLAGGTAFRDHSVWKEDGGWHMVIGSGIAGVGGTALLYRSPDLRQWEYQGPLSVGDIQRTDPFFTGEVWECPDFFPLGGKHVLVVSVWHERRLHFPIWSAGDFRDGRLTSEQEGMVDLGRTFYAPQSAWDRQGRRLMWGWLREDRDIEAQKAAGWSGVMSLPRVLSLLPDGALGMEPAPELQTLRGEHYRRQDIQLVGGAEMALEEPRGAALEIVAECDLGDASAIGLKVRCSPDGTEETVIFYDHEVGRLVVDRSRSSLEPGEGEPVVGGSFALRAGEALKLQIFVDASVLEVFTNGRACLCTRIYPSRPDSLGLALFARGGGASVLSLDIWRMDAIWEPGVARVIPEA